METPAASVVIPAIKDRLYRHVDFLTALSPARNAFNAASLEKAADYIFQELKLLSPRTGYQVFTAINREFKNVIASFGPEDGPRVLVGAHYDVWGNQPGADDNASGVAGMLELARLIATQEKELRYRFDFVGYCLEEPPFFRTPDMGSAVHAKSLADAGVDVKLMVCLEMIGYYSDKPGSQDFPLPALKGMYPDVGDFISVVGRLGEEEIVEQMKAEMLRDSDLKVYSINAPSTVAGVDFSDHQNFWAHNYPAVMITNTSFFRNPHYHTSSDTIDTLDFDRMTEVVRGLHRALLALE